MDESEKQTKRIEKPDLRGVNPFIKQKKVLLFGCFLVVLYMYPTIVKPLFQIGLTSKNDSKERRELLDKTRPSFMPEWSSPFGRSKEDD